MDAFTAYSVPYTYIYLCIHLFLNVCIIDLFIY